MKVQMMNIGCCLCVQSIRPISALRSVCEERKISQKKKKEKMQKKGEKIDAK